ncbi:DUF6361 family protein [Pseudomonas sp. GL-B-26]|uniref:DUF6361 family protein n=1 Tax=Pseudomonas sp. GL-B-26 TaxID=2832394 RepID=UPI001CBC0A52|nr:DUF6361 family protein [Pseudomonas sp. GL-B-26]
MGGKMLGKSQLGWVDFSADDRDRVKHALKQLSEPGTLDELGIGALRDGFADLMFPGFSTIQTRAKYFITVPRIIRDYLQLKPAQQRKQSLQNYLKEQETQLAKQLRDRHRNDGQTGISGFSQQDGESVSRQPSSIYWVGLRTWGLVNTRGSLNQFLRAIQSPEELLGSTQGDECDDTDAQTNISRVHLDRYFPQWRDDVCIQLTKLEAHFLSEKIKAGPLYSLPTQFEQQGLRQQALGQDKASFPALAAWVAGRKELPQMTRDTVRMAQAFSELIYGAHLRFNIILARTNKRDDLLEQFEKSWSDWRAEIRADPDDVPQWLSKSQIKLHERTELFLRSWSEGVARSAPEAELDGLVEKQARANKNERSILNKRLPENFEWLGMKRLDYRWWQVRTMLTDVQEGLAC